MRRPRPQRLADITRRSPVRLVAGRASRLPDSSACRSRTARRCSARIFVGNTDPVGAGEGECFTARDEEPLSQILAAHAAIALTNARLYEARTRAGDRHRAGQAGPGAARRGGAEAVQPPGPGPRRCGAGRPDPGGPRPDGAVGALGAEAHAELRAVSEGWRRRTWPRTGWPSRCERYAVLAGRAHGVAVRFTAADLPRWRGSGRRAVPGRARGAAQRAAARGGHPDRRLAVPNSPAGHPGGGRRRLRVRARRAGRPRVRLDARARRIRRGDADDPVRSRRGHHGQVGGPARARGGPGAA